MGHDKLRKFAENETFRCLLQPDAKEIMFHGENGELLLKDHPIKGRWGEKMFGNDHPIIVELGCGKGEYTIALAERHPEYNYIGVDIKGARLWKGAKYATVNSLSNVAFLRTRIEFLPALFAAGEVSEIWLTFSDPQMKSENSRLSSPLFLERYRSIMVPGGIVHLKTDSRFLHEYTMAVVAANSLRLLASTKDLYATAPEVLASAAGADGADGSVGSAGSAGSTGSAGSAGSPLEVQGPTESDKSDPSHKWAPPTSEPRAARPLDPVPPKATNQQDTQSFLHPEPQAARPMDPAPPKATSPQDDSTLELPDIEALYQVQTFYESMFLKMGIPITYMAFVIDHDGPYSYPEFDAAFWKAAEGPRRSFSHSPTKEK